MTSEEKDTKGYEAGIKLLFTDYNCNCWKLREVGSAKDDEE